MVSQSSSWQYNITQVSEITQLSKQVIRKWEERYQLVQPKRLENGHRVYSEDDLQQFLKVRNLSLQGYSIKQAVLKIRQQQLNNENLPVCTEEEMNEYTKYLLHYGETCNESEINRILHQATHILGLEKFLSSVVIPFLREVGTRWENNEWTEDQESVATMVIRDYLVQIRRNYYCHEDAPLLMCACLPGEYHEVPLHILMLQAMINGWRAFLVGSSPATGTIEALVTQLQPKVVLLSAITTIPFVLHPDIIQRLDEFAAKHPSIRFYIGGAGALEHLKSNSTNSIAVVANINDILKGKK
ncbi:MerR family transcriptional regulator [Solibacillus sp. A46]|uniref:MerR family transcriptional regulator n=1 Tax=Solibacillus faecavium TaxID=2762221 RepID=A0ABR8XZL9_9BACL|nr:MerR family transcriptional regulator [Solibacillus faecavium]MBD8037358.1 MerR family transcriptional regulator [Solibacillus faecavium]